MGNSGVPRDVSGRGCPDGLVKGFELVLGGSREGLRRWAVALGWMGSLSFYSRKRRDEASAVIGGGAAVTPGSWERGVRARFRGWAVFSFLRLPRASRSVSLRHGHGDLTACQRSVRWFIINRRARCSTCQASHQPIRSALRFFLEMRISSIERGSGWLTRAPSG